MTPKIHIIIERHGQPKGKIRLRDLQHLAAGFQDAMNRIIHLGLGYPATSKTKDDAEKRGDLYLEGIQAGSCDLVCGLETVPQRGPPPQLYALRELGNGIQNRRNQNAWPAWMPETTRFPVGRVVRRLLVDDRDHINVEVVNGTLINHFTIDRQMAQQMVEPDPIYEGDPVRLVGNISELYFDKNGAKVRCGHRTIEVGAVSKEIFEDIYQICRQRVILSGESMDHQCKRAKIKTVVKAADADEDGIFTEGEASGGEAQILYVGQKIEEFRTYKANWDSYGAKAISAQALNFAKVFFNGAYTRLAAHGFPQPDVFVCPTTTGGVQFEWTVKGRELELEIQQGEKFMFLKGDEEGSCDRWEAMRLIEWVATGGER